MTANRRVVLHVHRSLTQPAPVAVSTPDAELYRPMSGREAAAWLGIDPTTLSLWTNGGEIPFVRVGAKPRYLKADLLAWMRERAA